MRSKFETNSCLFSITLKDKVIKVEDDESEGRRHVILFPDKIMVTKPTTFDPKGKLEFEKIIEVSPFY